MYHVKEWCIHVYLVWYHACCKGMILLYVSYSYVSCTVSCEWYIHVYLFLVYLIQTHLIHMYLVLRMIHSYVSCMVLCLWQRNDTEKKICVWDWYVSCMHHMACKGMMHSYVSYSFVSCMVSSVVQRNDTLAWFLSIRVLRAIMCGAKKWYIHMYLWYRVIWYIMMFFYADWDGVVRLVFAVHIYTLYNIHACILYVYTYCT